MKMRVTVSLVALGILFMAACASPQAGSVFTPVSPVATPTTKAASSGSQIAWENTVAAAKKEGKVVVVTFIGAETRDALSKAFSARYGIDVEFVIGSPQETSTKIQAERNAGLYLSDVVVNGFSSLLIFRDTGVLDPLEPALMLPEVTDPKMWLNNQMPYTDEARYTIGFLNQFNSEVLRNTDLVKENEITSLRDLLKPQWKDKVIMHDPSVSGTGTGLWSILILDAWNQDEASKWLTQMIREQAMVITRDPRLQMEWVARGKYPVAVAVYTDQLVNFLAMGAPIAQQKIKEGGVATTSTGGLGLMKRPAHPNAAIVFVNWLLSKEGQIAFTSGFGGPSRRVDVKTEGVYAALMQMPGDKAFIFDEATTLKRNDLMKIAGQVIAQAQKK